MAAQDSFSLPPFPNMSELHANQHRRASLPLQRSESTSSTESSKTTRLNLLKSIPSASSSASSSPNCITNLATAVALNNNDPSIVSRNISSVVPQPPLPQSPSQLCAVCGDTAACQVSLLLLIFLTYDMKGQGKF